MRDHSLLRSMLDRHERLGITERDVIINYLPLFHIFGYVDGPLGTLIGGHRQVLTETFDADAALDLVEREGGTLLHGFETHMKALADAQEARPRNLSTLRTGILAVGMASAVPTAYRARRLLGPAPAPHGLRHHRGRRQRVHVRPRRHRRAGLRDVGPGVSRLRAARGRSRDRARPARRRARRALGPHALHDAGLLRQARGDGERPRRRRVVSHRRHGAPAPRRLHALRRPLQGHAQGGRRKRRPDGGRGPSPAPPGVHQVAVVGYPDARLAEVAVAFVIPKDGAAITGRRSSPPAAAASPASRSRATSSSSRTCPPRPRARSARWTCASKPGACSVADRGLAVRGAGRTQPRPPRSDDAVVAAPDDDSGGLRAAVGPMGDPARPGPRRAGIRPR